MITQSVPISNENIVFKIHNKKEEAKRVRQQIKSSSSILAKKKSKRYEDTQKSYQANKMLNFLNNTHRIDQHHPCLLNKIIKQIEKQNKKLYSTIIQQKNLNLNQKQNSKLLIPFSLQKKKQSNNQSKINQNPRTILYGQNHQYASIHQFGLKNNNTNKVINKKDHKNQKDYHNMLAKTIYQNRFNLIFRR